MCGAVLTRAAREALIAKTQELMLKGYNGVMVRKVINDERIAKGQRPLAKSSVHNYIKVIRREGSKYYLDLLKDHTAYIILHRQKLLTLELYRKMLHEKIDAEGGVKNIRPDTLNRIVTTLVNITVSESRLEKEIPTLFNIQAQRTPEEMKQIEDEIVAGLPKSLQDSLIKQEMKRQEDRDRRLKENPSEELIDLDQYPKDSFVV